MSFADVGVVASVVAAVGSVAVLWTGRKRQAFELTRVNDNTMLLRRVRRPAVVLLDDPFVLCHGTVPTLHRAGTLRNHLMRFGDERLLDVTGIPVGESVGIFYARVWSPRPTQARVATEKNQRRWARRRDRGKVSSWGGLRL